MWLPDDERRLLAGYYRIIGQVNEEKGYELSSLRSLLQKRLDYAAIREYHESASSRTCGNSNTKDEVNLYINDRNRIRKANRILAARDLITSKDHQNASDVVLVSLTVQGYDLGRKYSWWWTRSGLMFQEYKKHWIWLILVFLAGILAAPLIEFLKTAFI